jgi:hypothetical protein
MVHTCACCRLRFASTGELTDHVRNEHSEHPPFEEGTLKVLRRRFPAASVWGRVKRQPTP